MTYEQKSECYARKSCGYPGCTSPLGGGYTLSGYDPMAKSSSQGSYENSQENKFHMRLDL